MQTDVWRDALRKRIKTQRKSLDNASLSQVATCVLQHLIEELESAQHIAGYLAIGGEAPVDAALQHARAQGKNHPTEKGATTYVPVVDGASMHFVPVDENTRFQRNRFNILEPTSLPATQEPRLDLVLVPLLAFDARGNRLGMGGGFYDRYFAHQTHRPRLIGVAHEFQRVAELQPMPWDVPLDAIVTESGLTPARTR